MNKRGQVTLFIIIAIVIIAAIAFIIFLQKNIIGRGIPSSDVAEIKQYFSDCFETKTKEGIIFLGKQGGYYSLDGIESINFLDEETVYYWKADQNLVPSYETTQNELNNYLNNNVIDCFSSTSFSEYEIIREECAIDSIVSEMVSVEFNCPITIKKDESSSTIESFSINFEAPVKKLLDVSNQIIDEYREESEYFCITCYDDIAVENNVTITIVPIIKEIIEPEHVWFLITDKDIKFDDRNITWRFVAEL